jgi:hypothetical protein
MCDTHRRSRLSFPKSIDFPTMKAYPGGRVYGVSFYVRVIYVLFFSAGFFPPFSFFFFFFFFWKNGKERSVCTARLLEGRFVVVFSFRARGLPRSLYCARTWSPRASCASCPPVFFFCLVFLGIFFGPARWRFASRVNLIDVRRSSRAVQVPVRLLRGSSCPSAVHGYHLAPISGAVSPLVVLGENCTETARRDCTARRARRPGQGSAPLTGRIA